MHLITILMLLYACDGSSSKSRLSRSNSPYLQQHADNPVNWYEWGDEALEKARKENKPLLISIGYASCHWCHVMEKESFMDNEVAEIMNEHFVCIKVDREERPDIDQVYMDACQLISGGAGGWPLNAFALPGGKPFFASTYYPKEDWIKLLNQIATSYRDQFNKVLLQAEALTSEIRNYDLHFFDTIAQQNINKREIYVNYTDSLYHEIDFNDGGLKGRQKFPMPAVWEFLLQYHYFSDDQRALESVKTTLEKMAYGGIYDHVGGGFARYSTDEKWHIPHFEKMLYDNGQLMSLYANAYKATGSGLFKNVIYETAAFLERELVSNEGGFFSSLNADTEDGEGVYYSWTSSQFRTALGEKKANIFSGYYHLSEKGNWEYNRNILYTKESPEGFAMRNEIQAAAFQKMLKESKNALLDARNKRKKPGTDKKIITAWNALALMGFLDAFSATGDSSFLKVAIRNATFLENNMMGKDGSVWRNYMEGNKSVAGFLDDYALMAKAYIRLYQLTFDVHWLGLSLKISDFTVKNFYNAETGFFFFTSAPDQLSVRKTVIRDDALPSPNAVMADVLYSLGVYFDKPDYVNMSRTMVASVTQRYIDNTPFFASWFVMSGLMINKIHEVAIMGEDALIKNLVLQMNFLPGCLWQGETKKENLPLLENKLVNGKTKIYVCTDRVCKLPVDDVEKALDQIRN